METPFSLIEDQFNIANILLSHYYLLFFLKSVKMNVFKAYLEKKKSY